MKPPTSPFSRATPAPKSHATMYVPHDHPLAKAKVGAKVSAKVSGHVREIAKDNDTGKRVRVHLEGLTHDDGSDADGDNDADAPAGGGDMVCPNCGMHGDGPFCTSCGRRMTPAKGGA